VDYSKIFFNACKDVLDLENGEVDVALCRGQGGTPADADRRYDDSWKIAEMAADGGFVLTRVEPFESEYRKVGYRSLNKSFNASGALRHTFSFAGSPPSLSMGARKGAGADGGLESHHSRSSIAPSCLSFERDVKFPVEYRLHYSFWVHEAASAVEETLKNTVSIYFTDINVEIERLIDTFSREGLRSWCFELKIWSACYALRRTDAMITFCETLSDKLRDELPCFLARI